MELGRHGVSAEPGRHASCGTYRPELRQFGVVVESVAGLGLEGGRPRARHPVAVLAHALFELGPGGRAGRADGRHDPAPGRVQLLVRRASGAERELVHSISREAGMRMTVDEPWDGGKAAAVDLLDLAVERPEVAHATGRLDPAVVAEDVRVLHHFDVTEGAPAQRRCGSRVGDQLRQIPDEEAGHAGGLSDVRPASTSTRLPPTRA